MYINYKTINVVYFNIIINLSKIYHITITERIYLFII